VTGLDRVTAALVAAVVALAFADASIVVLGLPEIYGDLETTIVGVSWVVTIYAVAVTVLAVVMAFVHRWTMPLAVLVSGLIAFAVSSIVAAAADTLSVLLTARAIQGAGAALLLAGALPVLAALTGSSATGRRVWATAGMVGAVIGPAIGGILTQAFEWRAIFVVQAPIAGAALLVVANATARAVRPETVVVRPPRAPAANVAFAALFGASVGALFLAVLLLVVVWRLTPLAGAAVVSALPLATLAVRPLVGRVPANAVAVVAVVLLCGGLVGLALLPAAEVGYVVAALAACGAGLGLLNGLMGPLALDTDAGLLRAGTITNAARHAGLVIGLAVIAPVLATGLEDGALDAAYSGTAVMLDARLPLSDKLPVAWGIRTAINDAPAGEVPDLAAVFEARGAADDPALQTAEADLNSAIEDALTRAFRPSFLVAAGLGALALLPALLALRGLGRRPVDVPATLVLAGLGVGVVALIGVEVRAGAADFGTYQAADPCTASPTPYPGDGLDPAIQRLGLSALNGAACELGTTRELLVLSLDPDTDLGDVEFDQDTAETALRAGALRAIDDADERDSLPGLIATVLREIVERAPLDWLLDRFSIPGS
jgi:predicted MFS family arabinose efflux permease